MDLDLEDVLDTEDVLYLTKTYLQWKDLFRLRFVYRDAISCVYRLSPNRHEKPLQDTTQCPVDTDRDQAVPDNASRSQEEVRDNFVDVSTSEQANNCNGVKECQVKHGRNETKIDGNLVRINKWRGQSLLSKKNNTRNRTPKFLRRIAAGFRRFFGSCHIEVKII